MMIEQSQIDVVLGHPYFLPGVALIGLLLLVIFKFLLGSRTSKVSRSLEDAPRLAGKDGKPKTKSKNSNNQVKNETIPNTIPGDIDFDDGASSSLILPTTNHPVLRCDKAQQTDDIQYQKSQEEQQYPATITMVIGPHGGIICLYRYKVFYPPNSLTEEKEIELSIDNNPCNFPKDGLPVTSILNIKPSMKLYIPATVTMPTTCRAVSGEVSIQIWSKDEGQDWEKSQRAWLKTDNVISFQVHHFTGEAATTVPGNEDNLEHIIKNRLFIQKDTATFSSVFWQDDELPQENKMRYKEMKYVAAQPTDITLKGKVDAEFELKLECTSPSIHYSSGRKNPVIFKLKSNFLKARLPQSIEFHRSENIPDRTSSVMMEYSVMINGEVDKECPLSVPWPIEIEQQGLPPSMPDIDWSGRPRIRRRNGHSHLGIKETD